MWFFKKEKDVKLEVALEGLTELNKEVRGIKRDLLELETNQANLRGQFNRKLKGIAEFEAKNPPSGEKEPEEAKLLNKPVPKVFSGMHLGDIPK